MQRNVEFENLAVLSVVLCQFGGVNHMCFSILEPVKELPHRFMISWLNTVSVVNPRLRVNLSIISVIFLLISNGFQLGDL